MSFDVRRYHFVFLKYGFVGVHFEGNFKKRFETINAFDAKV